MSIYVQMVCGSFHVTIAELGAVTKTVYTSKLKILTIWPFTESLLALSLQRQLPMDLTYDQDFEE